MQVNADMQLPWVIFTLPQWACPLWHHGSEPELQLPWTQADVCLAHMLLASVGTGWRRCMPPC